MAVTLSFHLSTQDENTPPFEQCANSTITSSSDVSKVIKLGERSCISKIRHAIYARCFPPSNHHFQRIHKSFPTIVINIMEEAEAAVATAVDDNNKAPEAVAIKADAVDAVADVEDVDKVMICTSDNAPTLLSTAGLMAHVPTPVGFAKIHSQDTNIKPRLKTN